METLFMISTHFLGILGFKSYYVVWKPDEASEYTTITISFKSYYVVWKRRLTMHADKIATKFKSYYVVWKRKPREH